jgi:hypothetical protein
MNKNDYIIEVRQEISRLVHTGKEQRFKDTDSSIEYCFYNLMSVDEAVKTFF